MIVDETLSDDTRMRLSQKWLEELLQLAGFPAPVKAELVGTDRTLDSDVVASGSEAQSDDSTCWLTVDETNLTPEQIQTLTGLQGSVLDAVQYLANTILNLGQDQERQRAYTIELDGYRARRQAELQAMAEHAAEQVRQTGEEFEMKSLSSAERRQVHTLLKPCTDLETFSRGREPDRCLVVRRVQD
jgi:spoIIIJ-associated protein